MGTDFYSKAKSLDRSEKSIGNMMKLYTIKGLDYDFNNMYKSIVDELYGNTLEILEAKKKETGVLIDREIKIYNTCMAEINSKNKLKGIVKLICWGIIGNLINAYEAIYHMFPSGKDVALAQKLLQDNGSILLPKYSEYITSFITVIETMYKLDLPNFFSQIKALNMTSLQYRKDKADNKLEAHLMLKFANNSYGENIDFSEYSPLEEAVYPKELQPFYDKKTGIYNGGHGLKVWTAKKDNTIVISYSGTDVKNLYMDYEDFNQIFSASALYLEAAGFLKIITNNLKNKKFIICGHSLGGGLAQFSTAANVDNFTNTYTCYAYNPAGLSTISLEHLGNTRILKAIENIYVYVTTKDLVSLTGAKLGTLITLPATNHNGHGIAALMECMGVYSGIKDRKPAAFTNMDIYSCTLSKDAKKKSIVLLSTDGNLQYPIFNNKIEGKQNKLSTFLIDKAVVSNIINEERKKNFTQCLGVYNKLNGDAYTVLNRLGILNEQNETNIPLNIEHAFSILLFGTYGSGKEIWIKQILDAILDDNSSISKSNLDKYIYKLENEYEYMLQAISFILKEYNIQLDLFNGVNKDKKNHVLEIMYEYAINNKVLYFEYNYDRELTNEEIYEYTTKKLTLFEWLIETLLEYFAKETLMKEDKKESTRNNIMQYAKQYLEEL